MFSVIVPLYNKERFITRAIQSVLNQNFQDFEIIVINDGSTDNSLSVASTISDERLRIFTQENQGVSAARNKGAEMANYPYLAFLDGDDTWDKNFLSEIKKLIENFPDAGLYGSNNLFIYPNGSVDKNNVGDIFNGNEEGIIGNYFQIFADLQRSPFSNSNLCIPKNIYKKFGGYKVNVKLTEDSDLWCRIALEYPIAFTTKPLATYYLAQEGSTHGIFESRPFEVAIMLDQAVKEGKVKADQKESVLKLIALQKLGLIKRGILTKNKSKIINNFFDGSIVKYYPKEYIKAVAALLMPYSLFNRLKR